MMTSSIKQNNIKCTENSDSAHRSLAPSGTQILLPEAPSAYRTGEPCASAALMQTILANDLCDTQLEGSTTVASRSNMYDSSPCLTRQSHSALNLKVS